MDSQNLPRYQTDFNSVDQEGLVTTLPGWGGSVLVPMVADPVQLFDGDENTCVGIVESVNQDNGLITVRPLLETWIDGITSTLPELADALLDAMRRDKQGQETTNKPNLVSA